MKRLIVDASTCAGCRHCELVCSFYHERKFSPNLSRVTVFKDDKYGMDYPIFCRQCDACPPEETCPTKAYTRTKDGVVNLDKENCIKCGTCVEDCTFNAIIFDGSSFPVVCDLCGGNPICVERCPTGALSFKESDVNTETPEMVFRELRERWNIDA